MLLGLNELISHVYVGLPGATGGARKATEGLFDSLALRLIGPVLLDEGADAAEGPVVGLSALLGRILGGGEPNRAQITGSPPEPAIPP